MTTYIIKNKLSGLTLGSYDAENAAGALDAMARDAGYADHAAACAVAPVKDGELVVTAAPVFRAVSPDEVTVYEGHDREAAFQAAAEVCATSWIGKHTHVLIDGDREIAKLIRDEKRGALFVRVDENRAPAWAVERAETDTAEG